MVGHLLLISYHFPPFAGSSGVQRPLSLARYLGEFGWRTTVLTVSPNAYVSRDSSQLGDIPADVEVIRAKAFDLKQRFSILGHYPGLLAVPDRWNSWVFSAVPAGLSHIREQAPDVICSTFPIATAHLVGLRLARKTRLPWVADFRDSMTEDNYPRSTYARNVLRALERRVVKHANACVFTAPSCLEMYAERYPAVPRERFAVIENGYDETAFTRVESRQRDLASPADKEGYRKEKLVLLHSGVMYPEDRDPTPFLDALVMLKESNAGLPERLAVRFRASGHDNFLQALVSERKLGDVVQFEPGIPYDAALQEMLQADLLLLFQGGSCNHQIPAKIYEYLRAGRPMLALTDPGGDTAGVLAARGLAESVVDITDPVAIHGKLNSVLSDFTVLGPRASGGRFDDSRRERARRFAAVFARVAGKSGAPPLDNEKSGGFVYKP